MKKAAACEDYLVISSFGLSNANEAR